MAEITSEDHIRLLHERIELLIERHGWAVQGVFGDSATDTFSYTVGLERRGLPELIMVGLPADLACQLLNDSAQLMLDRGRAFEPGERVGEIIRDLDVLVGPVANSAEAQLTMANAHALLAPGDEPIAAVQLLWPDSKGRFPDEEGYNAGVSQELPS